MAPKKQVETKNVASSSKGKGKQTTEDVPKRKGKRPREEEPRQNEKEVSQNFDQLPSFTKIYRKDEKEAYFRFQNFPFRPSLTICDNTLVKLGVYKEVWGLLSQMELASFACLETRGHEDAAREFFVTVTLKYKNEEKSRAQEGSLHYKIQGQRNATGNINVADLNLLYTGLYLHLKKPDGSPLLDDNADHHVNLGVLFIEAMIRIRISTTKVGANRMGGMLWTLFKKLGVPLDFLVEDKKKELLDEEFLLRNIVFELKE